MIYITFIHVISVKFDGQNNILIHVQDRYQVIALENKTDLASAEDAQGIFLEPGDILVIHIDLTGGGTVQTAQHVQQRGFPAPAGPHHRQEFAPLHSHIHAVQGLYKVIPCTVIFSECFCLQYFHIFTFLLPVSCVSAGTGK